MRQTQLEKKRNEAAKKKPPVCVLKGCITRAGDEGYVSREMKRRGGEAMPLLCGTARVHARVRTRYTCRINQARP